MSNTVPPTADSPPEPRPLQFTLRSIFVVMIALALLLGLPMQFGCVGVPIFIILACIAIGIYKWTWKYTVPAFGLAILLVLLILAVQEAREAARRICCPCHLKQIGLALLNYEAANGSFPPAYIADADGKPMHSWRVLLLPYMEYHHIYDQYRFDEPWDGPNNRKLHDVILEMYRCPSEDNKTMSKQDRTMTSYVAVVGPRTAWPGSKSTKLADFSDGTANTLLIVEVADSGIHWMEPRDLHVLQMNPKINSKSGQGISSHHPGEACVVFADGCVRFLSDDLPPKTVKAMLTIDGGEEVSPEDWE
jgi:hypothetical protein